MHSYFGAEQEIPACFHPSKSLNRLDKSFLSREPIVGQSKALFGPLIERAHGGLSTVTGPFLRHSSYLDAKLRDSRLRSHRILCLSLSRFSAWRCHDVSVMVSREKGYQATGPLAACRRRTSA